MSIITRFPPSPTGYLHIGRARTALFNYLFAKHKQGKMIFRIEDTDRARSKKEYEENIIECLEWLGISYDSGPYRQSERNEIYTRYIRKMIEGGQAYISKESTTDEEIEGDVDNQSRGDDGKHPGKKRSEVIRFKNPNKVIKFTDLIRGEIEFDTTELKDFIIARSIEEPLYHLTVVADDFEMGITHVIRGDDGISNTPRQILLQEAIGAPRPIYAHVPLILAADRSKLSGRHGAIAVTEYRKLGYLPEAVINFLALLGWNPGTDQEIFSMDELITAFDISKVQKSGAVFNLEKLKWFNRQYILKLSDASFIAHASPFLPDQFSAPDPIFLRVLPLLREKISTFGEIDTMLTVGGDLDFIKIAPKYDRDLLLWKKNPDPAAAQKHLKKALDIIDTLPGSDAEFTADAFRQALWPYAEEHGKGDVLWPVRVALTGKERSPDPFTSASILGRDESTKRIRDAIVELSV